MVQWYRSITALTLHADLLHLTGNTVSGALFLPLLARLVGVGRAVYLTMLGGTAVVSMVFSTALFAVMGALAGVMSLQRRGGRNMFLPVAAGVGLLALLGTEGERTDYAARVAGLACGLVLGMCEAARRKRGLAGSAADCGIPACSDAACARLMAGVRIIMALRYFNF